MPSLRDVRRCALQVLYQLDVGNADAPALVRESLAGSPGNERTHEAGFELGQAAWELRAAADATVGALTPDWPTYRQPAIDRNILRLAYYEMHEGGTPPKVAINEAIELAKEFSTEKSPLFINGVLDKIYRGMREACDGAPRPGGSPGEEGHGGPKRRSDEGPPPRPSPASGAGGSVDGGR